MPRKFVESVPCNDCLNGIAESKVPFHNVFTEYSFFFNEKIENMIDGIYFALTKKIW
jgi:hypothetical protein